MLSVAATEASHGQSHDFFLQKYLDVKGKVTSLLVEDINRDDLMDVLVLHTDYQFERNSFLRYLSIFLQSEHGFDASPSQTLEADADDIFIDIAPADALSDSVQLMIIRADGIYARSFSNGFFRENVVRIITTPSIFWCADPHSLFAWDFCHQNSTTSAVELLIPRPGHLEIYTRSEDGEYRIFRSFAFNTDLHLQQNGTTASEVQSLSASFLLGQIVRDDFNGDGLDDLAIIRDDAIALYFTERDSCGPPLEGMVVKPDTQLSLGIMTLAERQKHIRNTMKLIMKIRDLNNDHLADIVLFKRNMDELFTAMAQVQIFLNKGGWFDTIPDHLFSAGNSGGEPYLADFNGDELIDVALMTSKLSLLALPKLILSRKVDCIFSFYYMQKSGVFTPQPDEKITLSYNVNLNDILPSSPLQYLSGDYNGDGRLDLLMETGIDEITFYWGQSRGVFNKKEYLKYGTKTSPLYLVTDLNSDRKSDILFWYGDDSDHQGTVNVLISQ